MEGSSARACGIEPGDIITAVNDHRIIDVDDFVHTARTLHAGDNATVVLRRGGREMQKIIAVKPRPYESAPDIDVLYRSIAVDGSLRRVIVTVPKTPGKYPAIIYVNGLGCFSQESLDLSSNDAKLLYGLTRAGFVTMRVEKSGMGDSQGPPCRSASADLNAELRSYLEGLRRLKRYSFVDPDKVFIVGISLGGVEAPIIAQQEQVAGIAVINTVAKPFLEYLLETRRLQHQLRHTPYDETDHSMQLNELCNHQLLIEKESPEQIVKDNPACGECIDYPAPYTLMCSLHSEPLTMCPTFPTIRIWRT
jgi:hypothetical protein